jgi:hypothetical protein
MDSSSSQANKNILSDKGEVYKFLLVYLLHWFEALSLLRRLPEGVLMTQMLQSIVDVSIIITSVAATNLIEVSAECGAVCINT